MSISMEKKRKKKTSGLEKVGTEIKIAKDCGRAHAKDRTPMPTVAGSRLTALGGDAPRKGAAQESERTKEVLGTPNGIRNVAPNGGEAWQQRGVREVIRKGAIDPARSNKNWLKVGALAEKSLFSKKKAF